MNIRTTKKTMYGGNIKLKKIISIKIEKVVERWVFGVVAIKAVQWIAQRNWRKLFLQKENELNIIQKMFPLVSKNTGLVGCHHAKKLKLCITGNDPF